MFKKLFLFLCLLFLFFWNVFAQEIKVENVFSDINSDYKYLNELQTLYDKWMIVPDANWKFNPYQLLTREDFVWITMEVSCKKCVKPKVDYYFIDKYNTKPFYDVDLNNKNFYCIADASNNNYINWYDIWYKCENWTYREWEKPFCTQNNIVLEEALAIILRVSWILDNEQAQSIRNDILNWNITKSLSDDVNPKNLDWSVYSFYPDFMKALEYEVVDYDQYWNKNIYHLVEVIDWKLRPKKNITKEEFLRIAYVALKANNCLEKTPNNLWLQMKIYDSNCNPSLTNCKLSNLNSWNIYDFSAEAFTNSEKWISEPNWYVWRFYNRDTGEEYIKYWKYIDNYEFLQDWVWDIYLRVIDNEWNTAEVKNVIKISNKENIASNNDNLIVSIKANPINWLYPLKIDLDWIVIWNNWPYSYEWDFWNQTKWLWKKQEIIYKNYWVYEIKLKVTDKDWNTQNANVFIFVDDNNDNLNKDTDWDLVLDINDYCPLVKWQKQNNWCPILSNSCTNDLDCKVGFYCKINNNYWVCETIELNKNNVNLCNYNWWSLISWWVICESCPCSNSLDFISNLRQCDIIFPAITSPDNTKIYSRWDFYQIK